jgi:hypothetical protein
MNAEMRLGKLPRLGESLKCGRRIKIGLDREKSY